MGTFQYMAPEQVEGGEADARTDVWASGALLYEMATGRMAFAGKSQASLIASILKEEPPPIRELAPVMPPALDRLVRTCLAKDPDERMQSARDVGHELGLLAAFWIGRRSEPTGESDAPRPSPAGWLGAGVYDPDAAGRRTRAASHAAPKCGRLPELVGGDEDRNRRAAPRTMAYRCPFNGRLSTPQAAIDLIRQRLKLAVALHETWG